MSPLISEITINVDWENFFRVFVGTPLKIIVIVALCIISFFLIVAIINRVTKQLVAKAQANRSQVARRTERTEDLSEVLMSQRRKARAEAIASLLRSITAAIIAAIGILLILGQLDINIAPLVASAGVLGVALGFGAQSLVKDYLSGIFLILEDQYGVGDVVDLGPVVGTVEDVTLRVTQLRDMSGVVWYVRNGEVLRVANRSQGWTMAIVDIPINYNENLDKVRSLVESVATEMDTDERFDEMLLGKPQYAGVETVTGDSMTIRVTVKTVPEQQINATRILRERIKMAFDAAGIRMPSPPVAQDPAPAADQLPPSSLPSDPPPPKKYGTGPLKP